MDLRRVFGNSAEELASRFLKGLGYKIIEKQFRTKFGEIDLIAMDGNEVIFVEVKARKSTDFGYPEESVTKSKLRKIAAVSSEYLHRKKLDSVPFRIDVIAIDYSGKKPDLKHIIGVG